MFAGLRYLNLECEKLPSHKFIRPQHDIAVFYGLSEGLRRVYDAYRDDPTRTLLFVDLGYWSRRKRTRWDGYHKIIANARHPNAYFQDRAHPHDRVAVHGLKFKPWREPTPRGHILVAGMSGKAAAADGILPERWERGVIHRLRNLTKRQIVYRPKPNWIGARPIPGSTFGINQTLEDALEGCHAVVSHHSNVAIEALVAGIPCFLVDGAGRPMSGCAKTLDDIETPPMPETRQQWAADLAYTQWSLQEMQTGKAWLGLRKEGLVP